MLRSWIKSSSFASSWLHSRSGRPDPAIEARILFATIDGVCQHSVLLEGDYPADEIGEAIIARYATTG